MNIISILGRYLAIQHTLAEQHLATLKRIIELEKELKNEQARRADFERMVMVTALAIAERGSLDMDGFIAV